MSTIPEIITLLKKASDAYYNTGTPIMDDDAYDALREKLEEMDPNNPFLSTVGAPVTKGTKLPSAMPSLQKIKPHTGSVESFASGRKSFVLSDKLDGLSALYDTKKKKLYLRGDGLVGVDCSHLVPFIQGLHNPKPLLLRGELMVKTSDVTATIPRSWTNGVVHQKVLKEDDARKIRFVAYEVIEPQGLTRSRQFEFLKEMNYEVPWHTSVKELTDESLIKVLTERRATCPYMMDGIVVGEDSVPVKSKDASLPKDMRAFKMTMSDQCKESTVVAVHWAPSYQRYLIPRIEIQPVLIGGANITFLTGHNAKNIEDKKIGPGSKIMIRRSGDVIPTLDHVLLETTPSFPPSETYKWDATHTHIQLTEGSTEEFAVSKLQHFTKTLGIMNFGPGLVAKVVAKGVTGPKALYALSANQLSEIIGPTTGQKIYDALRAVKPTEMMLMIASSLMPRGVGETKLSSLFELEADPRKWLVTAVEGWSAKSLNEFLEVLPVYEKWRKEELPQYAYPILSAPVVMGTKGSVCFSGFRSADLEASLKAKGYEIGDSVTKKTVLLVVASVGESSGKVKKANELKIKIVTKEEALNI